MPQFTHQVIAPGSPKRKEQALTVGWVPPLLAPEKGGCEGETSEDAAQGSEVERNDKGRARAVYFCTGMPRRFETAQMSCPLEQLLWNGAFMWVQTWFQVFFLITIPVFHLIVGPE